MNPIIIYTFNVFVISLLIYSYKKNFNECMSCSKDTLSMAIFFLFFLLMRRPEMPFVIIVIFITSNIIASKLNDIFKKKGETK